MKGIQLTEKIAPILLGAMTYMIAYKKLLIYAKDNQIVLWKEYLINKIFIYPDYINYPYLEGGSAFDLIPPFLFYLMVMMVGAFFFFSVNKNFFQYCSVRVKNIQQLIAIIQKKAILRMLLFSGSYYGTILCLIVFGNTWKQESYFQQIIRPGLLLFVANSILLIGLWKLLFYSYLRFTELSFVLLTACTLWLLLLFNNHYPAISLFFLWSDSFWYLRVIIGGSLFVLSLIMDRKVTFTL